MNRFISKLSMPETLDINTATSLVYMGLIILTAYLTYFYTPVISLVLIFVLCFQRKWKIENHLIKLTVLAMLLPLLTNLFFVSLKEIIIISFNGFSYLKSDMEVHFTNPTYNLLFKALHLVNQFLTCVVIATISATQLLLNIAFPIGKKIWRIIICLKLQFL